MKIFDTRLILKNSVQRIESLLRDELKIAFLEVLDESALHAGHVGVISATEILTHVYIRIQADELNGLSRIEQHRKIYATLQHAIDDGLHAIRFQIL
jgi:BolA protein